MCHAGLRPLLVMPDLIRQPESVRITWIPAFHVGWDSFFHRMTKSMSHAGLDPATGVG